MSEKPMNEKARRGGSSDSDSSLHRHQKGEKLDHHSSHDEGFTTTEKLDK